MSKQKYEYELYPRFVEAGGLEGEAPKINDKAKDGWRVHTITWPNQSDVLPRILFEREVN